MLYRPDPKPITAQQTKAIHLAKRAQGIDDDLYLEMLSAYGVDSSKFLTMDQANDMIKRLQSGGFKIKSPRREPKPSRENITVMATPRQLAYIGHLVAEVNWRQADGYQRWLDKSFGLDAVRTKEQATMVIQGLKNMKATGERHVSRLA